MISNNLTKEYFKTRIAELTVSEAIDLVKQSRVNHHVKGLDYICLKRTPELTVKIYIIDRPDNDQSGFLVHPHNHRYNFDSIILKGSLKHYRFKEDETPKAWTNCDKFKYQWENRKVYPMRKSNLMIDSVETCKEGSKYNVETHEIHTLEILEPTVIGIFQYMDRIENTNIYLPHEVDFYAKSPQIMHLDYFGMKLKELREIW